MDRKRVSLSLLQGFLKPKRKKKKNDKVIDKHQHHQHQCSKAQ